MPADGPQILLAGPVVVDASVAVEYLVALPLTPHARSLFRAVLEWDVELWAPDLIYAESASALRRLVALRALDREAARTALRHLLQLPALSTGTKPLMEEAWSLRESVTIYDACYAALARTLEAPWSPPTGAWSARSGGSTGTSPSWATCPERRRHLPANARKSPGAVRTPGPSASRTRARGRRSCPGTPPRGWTPARTGP